MFNYILCVFNSGLSWLFYVIICLYCITSYPGSRPTQEDILSPAFVENISAFNNKVHNEKLNLKISDFDVLMISDVDVLFCWFDASFSLTY